MLADETAGLDEVAAAIGRPAGWLRRNWLRIHLEDGFPRKHPTGWTWPRAAVAVWLRAAGMSRPQDFPANDNPLFDNPSGDPDAAWRQALDDRYGGNP